ncbi:unnamed protein product [Rotaria socialis]|uniref:Ras-GAP domain-containing protein n=1 Tax=Rotaria socialis TaxID=392032 RepID=A0A819X2J9_9BILA|nr:unnamed protein product [Rotaria socialis]CAF4284775.1 unnamed protein product [Rotaria socialis]
MADCYQTILRGIGLPTKIMYIANLCSYEVDPSRRFQPIIDSPLQFPLQLRILCSCLYQVVQQCSPQYPLQAVSTVIFLRFLIQ